jgi:hypothetical protein
MIWNRLHPGEDERPGAEWPVTNVKIASTGPTGKQRFIIVIASLSLNMIFEPDIGPPSQFLF